MVRIYDLTPLGCMTPYAKTKDHLKKRKEIPPGAPSTRDYLGYIALDSGRRCLASGEGAAMEEGEGEDSARNTKSSNLKIARCDSI